MGQGRRSQSDVLEVVQRISQAPSDVQINYQPIGSGGGIRQVTAGTVDFGASDMPMTDQQLKDSKIKILNIPTCWALWFRRTTFRE
jgi:ABC-type phosphate transport system substrate-binding protein